MFFLVSFKKSIHLLFFAISLLVVLNRLYTDIVTMIGIKPLTTTVAIWVQLQSIKHPLPDRSKPPFVIFDIWAL